MKDTICRTTKTFFQPRMAAMVHIVVVLATAESYTTGHVATT